MTSLEPKKKKKAPREPEPEQKLSMRDRMANRIHAADENFTKKYPKVGGYLSTFKDVWKETFPNAERKVADKQAKRRERAKMAREWEEKQKDMTPEEIEAMEESVPEWKRGAL